MELPSAISSTLYPSRVSAGRVRRKVTTCQLFVAGDWLELDKSYQASDWTIRPLSQAQIDYAALDVEVLIDLHGVFTGNGFLNERKMHV